MDHMEVERMEVEHMEVERMEVEHMEVERTKVVGMDHQSRFLFLEVEHMEVKHTEVVGMSIDRTDNDMALEVPPEPEVQQGGIMPGVAAKS
jgi:hypothetical protein